MLTAALASTLWRLTMSLPPYHDGHLALAALDRPVPWDPGPAVVAAALVLALLGGWVLVRRIATRDRSQG